MAKAQLDPNLFPVTEHTLKNGLRVRLQEDHAVPTVTYYTFFRVGSRNERPGMTGIAHLFEHMMFNGAQKYGPKQFDRTLESNGGYSNAFTSNDMTAYYEDFASFALPQVIDLESDRMRSLTISDATLEQERKVVMEERRLRTDNDILGLLDEQLGATMWNAHPYRWPVIGWMGDIEAISKEQCQAFFHTYYAPNNATIYVVGDFDSKEALALIESHYGDIPSGPALPSVPTYEPAQKGERRAMVRYPAQSEALLIGYHAPAATDARVPALDLIQYALSAGEGAILNKTLVYEQEVAVNVMVDFGWRIDPGAFLFFLELAPGVPAKKAEEALFAEIAKIAEKGLSKNDFERAREMLTARSLRELATHNGRASAFGSAELLLGDWKAALSMVERYREVTPEQVKAIAAELFDPSRRSVITLDPTDPNAKPAKAKPAKSKPAKSAAAKKKPAKRARA